MRRLLIPTDFSAEAQNALDYGVALADQMNSAITLLHVLDGHPFTGAYPGMDQYLRKKVAQQLLQEIKRIEGAVSHAEGILSKIVQGPVVKVIAELATDYRYDLIVMGTAGATGWKALFEGSHASRLVKEAQLPTLIIPEQARYRAPVQVGLAIDDKQFRNDQILAPLIALLKKFETNLRVFHVDTGEGDLGAQRRLETALQSVPHVYHYEFGARSIEHSIEEFIKDFDIELLCMVHHSRTLFGRWFTRSHTLSEVLQPLVPLLILHD